MAKIKKVVEGAEEQIPENIDSDHPINESTASQETEELMPVKKENPIYIPDIPAQMIEPVVNDNKETETEFLLRILQIQEDGGFGRHLNGIIYERIKLIS